MWDQKSEDGTIYDANKHPNVVDPHTFFDKEGKTKMNELFDLTGKVAK